MELCVCFFMIWDCACDLYKIVIIYRQWVLLWHNCPYNFVPIVLKLCFGKGELILVLFVHLFDLYLFGFVGFLLLLGLGRAAVCDCGTPWTFILSLFVYVSSQSETMHVFYITLALITITFYFVHIVFSDLRCIDSGYLVIASPHTILYQSFWNFAYFIFHYLQKCMLLSYNF